MPQNQGTGHHSHKSSEEPYPHHEAPTTSGEGRSSSEGRSSNEERSQSEPRASGHSSGSHSSENRSHSSETGSRSSENRNESGDLKSREYKDPQGQEHHHTHTYMEQHKKSA